MGVWEYFFGFIRMRSAAFKSIGFIAIGIALQSTPAAAFVCENVIFHDGGDSNASGGNDTTNMACGIQANAISTNGTATAIGSVATAAGQDAIALGFGAKAGDPSVSVFTNGQNIAIGSGAHAGTTGAVQFGAIALGTGATADVTNGIAIGNQATSMAEGAVALGPGAVADRTNTVSVGTTFFNRQIVNVAAGTSGSDAVNLDQLNAAVSSIAAPVQADNSNMRTTPSAAATDALATGFGSSASANNSTAVGNAAVASAANSVAIGFGSVANVANTFSVGAAGATRAIVNVTAGAITSTSTDAINGQQLFTANQRVANAFGGGAGLDANGQLTAPTYTIAGVNYNNVGSALAAISTSGTTYFQSNSTGPGASATGTNSVAMGSGATASNTNTVAIGTDATATQANSVAIGSGSTTSAANTVSVGSAGNERRITNVAAGISPTDAVNVGQLNGAVTGLQSQIGGLQNQIVDNRNEARGGVALALASAGLHFDPRPGKLSVAGSYGNFKGVSGLALGLGYAATDRVRFNATVSGSPDQGSMGGVVAGSFTLN